MDDEESVRAVTALTELKLRKARRLRAAAIGVEEIRFCLYIKGDVRELKDADTTQLGGRHDLLKSQCWLLSSSKLIALATKLNTMHSGSGSFNLPLWEVLVSVLTYYT